MNILISGAGIAGPVVAYWLLQADPSHRITIIERDVTLRTTGQSIDIRQSAVDIIKRMGIEPAIRAKTTNESGVRFVDDNGVAVAEFPMSGDDGAQGITSEYEIMRGDLVRILFDLIEDDDRVEVVYDKSVDTFEQNDDGVKVLFNDGKQQVYDVVIACDGQSSRIRKLALGTSSVSSVSSVDKSSSSPDRQHWRAFYQYVSYFTADVDLLHGDTMASWYNSTQGRIIFIRPDPRPGKCRVNVGRQLLPSDKEGNETYRQSIRSPEKLKALFKKDFQGAGWMTDEVLQAMDQTDDFYASETAQIICPYLVNGRVALVGDAGFCPSPLTGMGTSLAIIGAYVLAGELSRATSENRDRNHVVDALKRYNDIVHPLSRSIQNIPTILPRLVNPQTSIGLYIVRTILRIVWWSNIASWGSKITIPGLAAFQKKTFEPPEYEWKSRA